MGTKGSKYHPARISGKQKFLRKLEYDKQFGGKKKKKTKDINIKKKDWSLTN